MQQQQSAAPFSAERYFCPATSIEVSPLVILVVVSPGLHCRYARRAD
jgi:hypothetical protein